MKQIGSIKALSEFELSINCLKALTLASTIEPCKYHCQYICQYHCEESCQFRCQASCEYFCQTKYEYR